MDRLFHHHERHLDTYLIERILANGPQGGLKKKSIKTSRAPRPRSTYRQNSLGSNRGRWAADREAFKNGGHFGGFHLNRSQKWMAVRTYAQAREQSPSSQPVR